MADCDGGVSAEGAEAGCGDAAVVAAVDYGDVLRAADFGESLPAAVRCALRVSRDLCCDRVRILRVLA